MHVSLRHGWRELDAAEHSQYFFIFHLQTHHCTCISKISSYFSYLKFITKARQDEIMKRAFRQMLGYSSTWRSYFFVCFFFSTREMSAKGTNNFLRKISFPLENVNLAYKTVPNYADFTFFLLKNWISRNAQPYYAKITQFPIAFLYSERSDIDAENVNLLKQQITLSV